MACASLQWRFAFMIAVIYAQSNTASAGIQKGDLDPCSGMVRGFCSVVDFALNGSVYRTNVTRTHSMCVDACEAEPGCQSTNFMYAATLSGGQCQLNSLCYDGNVGALVEKPGWVYSTVKLPRCPEKLQNPEDYIPGSSAVTATTHQMHANASNYCRQKGQHLCELWELEAGNVTTLPQHVSLWYAVPDSQVVLNGGVVSYHGLPVIAPSLGVCCNGAFVNPQDPLVASAVHTVSDRDGMGRTCAALAAHLCTLPELKAAYQRGYRQLIAPYWMYFAIPNHDVMLEGNDCGPYIGDECYEDSVVTTPRPPANGHVYCCPDLYRPQRLEPGYPIITTQSFNLTDRDAMMGHCSALSAHLCTLDELKAAYLNGYRQPTVAWPYYAMPDYDARIYEDGCGSYTTTKCYDGAVAYTQNPHPRSPAFCCKNLYCFE